MTLEATEGGWYLVHVDQSNLSVYVSWTLSNDVIRTDDEFPYYFYQYPRNRLVGTPGPGPGPSSADGNTIMSGGTESTTDTTPPSPTATPWTAAAWARPERST